MIDTHCHLIDPQFKKDVNEVIKRAYTAGIKNIINLGYDIKTSRAVIEMNETYDWILPAIGIHPNETAEESIAEMSEIENLCLNKKVVAIGETGLDYYRNFSPRKAQQQLFRSHIEVAKKYNLPLIIHTRNSIDDAINILNQDDFHRGVFHCYSGSYEQAKRIIDLGFYLGFGGVLTFSKNMRDVFLRVGLKNIVFETDAPFLAPAGHRGQRNEPAYLIEILNLASSIRGISVDQIEEITDNNAHMLFALNK